MEECDFYHGVYSEDEIKCLDCGYTFFEGIISTGYTVVEFCHNCRSENIIYTGRELWGHTECEEVEIRGKSCV